MDSVRQILAIGLVFSLLGIALWILRKKAYWSLAERKTPAGRVLLESRGKLMLGPQHALHVVRIGERDLALAVHPSGIVLLCHLESRALARNQES